MTILDDLIAAGLPAIDAQPGVTPHFSRPLTLAEEVIRDSIMNKPAWRRVTARGNAKLSTQLRTLTPQQAVDYIETNVTNLATAKDVLKIMARILIALRDEAWPDLPDEP